MSSVWRNWAGNVVVRPSAVSQVSTREGVLAAVRAAGTRGARVRVAGSGHSFTPLVDTDGVLLRLDGMSGVVAVDRDRMRVRVLAGTPLYELTPALHALGLALPNLGDIDRQTISGAVATGTHGTGARLRGLADAVCALTLVLADGSVLECSPEQEPDVFLAARVGLGALGVVVEVELQCVPAFLVRAQESGESFSALLERLQEEADTHDHLDVHWFPHTDRALVKRNNRVDPHERARPLPRWRRTLDDDLLANRVFEVVNRAVSWAPGVAPQVNRATARALSAREYVDESWRVFCSRRDVRFVESEYAVPREVVGDVLHELRAWIDRTREPLPIPVEIRFAAADDTWLSTAYERDNAYVAVHQYHRMEHREYIAAFEAIVAEYDGRPHWGKLHSLGADELRGLYPRFEDFLAVRDRLDPQRRFTNTHLRRLLGD